jgi:hypothetical protein
MARVVTNEKLTVIGDARTLRALVRKALRAPGGVAMTEYEEQCIEDAFLRLARLQQPAAKKRRRTAV